MDPDQLKNEIIPEIIRKISVQIKMEGDRTDPVAEAEAETEEGDDQEMITDEEE